MNRRAFIAVFGGAAAWPVMAQGQKPPTPTIGYLHQGSQTPMEYASVAF